MIQSEEIRSRAVARKLSESILDGKIGVGSFLPSTRVLASQFGVSLGTIHVALRELQMQNLIECLPRRGAIVRQAQRARVTDSANAADEVRPSFVGVVWQRLTDWNPDPVSWEKTIVRSAGERLFTDHFTLAQLPWFESGQDFRQTMKAHLDRLGSSLSGVLTCWLIPELDTVVGELDRRNIPWITISRQSIQFPYNFVEADNLGSMRLLGRCCALSDTHRIAYLTSSMADNFNAMNKLTGFFQGFFETGVATREIDVINVEGVHEIDGYRAVQQYLESGKKPQAVIAYGDVMGLGAQRGLIDAGLKVPDDIGVIALTGTQLSAKAHPAITVVAQPMERMGQTAADMLSEMIRDGTRRLLGRHIPCQLIFRDSFPMPSLMADEVRRYNEQAIISHRPLAVPIESDGAKKLAELPSSTESET